MTGANGRGGAKRAEPPPRCQEHVGSRVLERDPQALPHRHPLSYCHRPRWAMLCATCLFAVGAAALACGTTALRPEHTTAGSHLYIAACADGHMAKACGRWRINNELTQTGSKWPACKVVPYW